MSQVYQESFSINANITGLVLGKGRSNVKAIEEKYGVKIHFKKGSSHNELVLKSSLSDSMKSAAQDLRHLISDKSDFYYHQQFKRKRYQKRLADIRFKKKEKELRKSLMGEKKEEKPEKKLTRKEMMSNNPFAILDVSDSDEGSDNQVESDQEIELEYDLIDQSEIPPHSPTLGLKVGHESDPEEEMICQKCIDQGRTCCPCANS